MSKKFLVAGLGNPGKAYEKTRHNLGFEVVSKIADECGFSFSKEKEFSGKIARGMVGDNELTLLMPTTYMNESGTSIVKVLQYYKFELSHLLVIVDDVEISFGDIRLRAAGSSGGHNGLKSVEEQLGSQAFARLRVGVGRNLDENLADYVLSKFKSEEEKRLPEIVGRAAQTVKVWFEQGLNRAVEYLHQTQA